MCPAFGKEPYMRLLVVLPDFFVLVRPVAQIAAIALLLGGCSAFDDLSSGPHALGNYSQSSTFFLTDIMPVRAPKEMLDRYACASELPLICECIGRVASTCDCHC
jgi:hypothetical protein